MWYWYILTFYTGAMVGFFIRHWLQSKTDYDGKIVVTHENHRTLYSLELEDYPEKIEFKKEIILKVDASEESLDRD